MFNWYVDALKKYATFEGRSPRRAFWYFYLVILLISLALALPSVIWDLKIFLVFLVIFSFAMIIPYVSVSVRRLHDAGMSGWWFLISLIPYVGVIMFLVMGCLKSEPKDNRFGAYEPDLKTPNHF